MISSFVRIFCASAVAISLSACAANNAPIESKASDIASAKAFFKASNDRNTVKSLTKKQVKELAAWLDTHQSGWKSFSGNRPIANAVIIVRYTDGRTSDISLFSTAKQGQGWGKTVLIERSDADENITETFADQDLKLLRSFVK